MSWRHFPTGPIIFPFETGITIMHETQPTISLTVAEICGSFKVVTIFFFVIKRNILNRKFSRGKHVWSGLIFFPQNNKTFLKWLMFKNSD
jgi:hypothetical protein